MENTKEIVIPEGKKIVKSGIYDYNRNPVSIKMPSSVVEIGDSAFSMNYGLISINIPSSVTRINYGLFITAEVLITSLFLNRSK